MRIGHARAAFSLHIDDTDLEVQKIRALTLV